MIDDFAILLTHSLLLLVAMRLLARADLDSDALHPPPRDPADGDSGNGGGDSGLAAGAPSASRAGIPALPRMAGASRAAPHA